MNLSHNPTERDSDNINLGLWNLVWLTFSYQNPVIVTGG